jgi:hypothetical protein
LFKVKSKIPDFEREKAKILTPEIPLVFRGFEFEPDGACPAIAFGDSGRLGRRGRFSEVSYVARHPEYSTTIHVHNPRVGSYISFSPEIYGRRSPFQSYEEQILWFEASQARLREAVREQAHSWRYDRLRPETRPLIPGASGPALEG